MNSASMRFESTLSKTRSIIFFEKGRSNIVSIRSKEREDANNKQL